jgi:hypothetical protein
MSSQEARQDGTQATRPLPIIHINGYPGTGKKTIATHLLPLISPYTTSLIHNHQLINPAAAILPRTSPDYQPLRKAIRTAVFDALATSRDTFGSVYVFTDFQSTDEVGSAVMEEYKDMARRRGCVIVPVTLTCEEGENLRRLVSEERETHGKIVDVKLATHFRKIEEIYEWSDNPFHLELDVTELEAEAAAEVLRKHILKVFSELGHTSP